MKPWRSALPALALGLVGLLTLGGPATGLAGGNKELMSIRMAQTMATRGLTESMVGLKVRSNEVHLSDQPSEITVDAKISAVIKGVQHSRPKYDPQRDIAMVEGSLKLGDVSNVIGKKVRYNNLTIKRIGFGTTSAESRPFLNALRAAELDAYDQLARTIVGQEIKSVSKTRNMVLESDEVRSSVLAAIWGAEVVDYGWTEDGSAFVKMKLDARYVKDVMGDRTRYNAGNVIEVTGMGATHDDTKDVEHGQGGRAYDTMDMKLPPPANGGKRDLEGGASTLR